MKCAGVWASAGQRHSIEGLSSHAKRACPVREEAPRAGPSHVRVRERGRAHAADALPPPPAATTTTTTTTTTTQPPRACVWPWAAISCVRTRGRAQKLEIS
jgi:hypothetical protein